jgi:hypothetical protein
MYVLTFSTAIPVGFLFSISVASADQNQTEQNANLPVEDLSRKSRSP